MYSLGPRDILCRSAVCSLINSGSIRQRSKSDYLTAIPAISRRQRGRARPAKSPPGPKVKLDQRTRRRRENTLKICPLQPRRVPCRSRLARLTQTAPPTLGRMPTSHPGLITDTATAQIIRILVWPKRLSTPTPAPASRSSRNRYRHDQNRRESIFLRLISQQKPNDTSNNPSQN